MNRSVIAGAVVCGAILGYFAAKYADLTFQPNIDADDLLALLIGIVLFLWLNIVYQKTHSDIASENEVIRSIIRDIISAVDAVDHAFVSCCDESPLTLSSRRLITDRYKAYANAVYMLESVLDECQISKESAGFSEIQRDREEYRVVLTDSPYPASRVTAKPANEGHLKTGQ